MAYLTLDDLIPFATIEASRADAMIADAMAQAIMVAPCLADESKLTDQQKAVVKSVLRRCVLRWHETGNTGSRSASSLTYGPFGQSETITQATSKGLFWPSEITSLQDICAQVNPDPSTGGGRAFHVDQMPVPTADNHQPWCSIIWGAWCSCGAVLTAGEFPLFEGGALS